MRKIKVINVVGARPNFMKIAPMHALMLKNQDFFESILLHTGQHYDKELSEIFLSDLGLPAPQFSLGIGSGTHSEQIGRIMISFEKVCCEVIPDLVIVVGDVNSTVACALVASKLQIPVAHVEAGLRSFDPSMPEEINRKVTDLLSQFLFTHSREANQNLSREGIADERIFLVGNTMIDTLKGHLERAEVIYQSSFADKYKPKSYGLITLHRPSNVDDREQLEKFLKVFEEVSRELPLIFPVHPRTRKHLNGFGFQEKGQLTITTPLGYLEFLALMKNARIVITDSGGIQEETTFLDIPCVTVRNNTERPVTITSGTNILSGIDPDQVRSCIDRQLNTAKRGRCPELWDGHTSERIIEILIDSFFGKDRGLTTFPKPR